MRMCDLGGGSAILNFMTEFHFSENYFSIFLTQLATIGSNTLSQASLMLNDNWATNHKTENFFLLPENPFHLRRECGMSAMYKTHIHTVI